MSYFRERLVEGWWFRVLGKSEALAPVCLPHNPFVADLDGMGHWQGVCEYKRTLQVATVEPDKKYALYFGAAMHTATVEIDGEEVGCHRGGYLPFEFDVTRWLADGLAHELSVVLNNRDDEDVPPGKRSGELDFCCYGGLYREVELRAYPALHITDPVAAGVVAGGGLFIRTEGLDAERAKLLLSVHVANGSSVEQAFTLRYEIFDDESRTVLSGFSDEVTLAVRADRSFEFSLSIANPRVWSLETPRLHTVAVSIVASDGSLVHRAQERFGIRWIEASRSGGLKLNGVRIRPRGTNRHQDYPRVGYALSAAAQYRDAKRIKEAGFDYVRLSHYPQSPAFLDACDELGILVMNCIPGWQFIGGEAFRQACYRNARDLVRRDRNHPSVIFWELSLNETQMDEAFMDRMMQIGHEEYPGDQMLVCGWIDRFDVFIHSRQHGQIHTWKNKDKALVVAEYGDWEFYASNDGFDQKTGSGLLADWSNSRAFRREGERRLRRQARNHIIALNDTMSSPAICDGLWSMFDYPRGYNPTRAACGVMDIHRLPKYSYFFYRCQRAPSEGGERWSGGPMVYIASRWVEDSVLDVLVFSNCDTVSLEFNNKIYGPFPPSRTNQGLAFPPFLFQLERFEAGCLIAVGYIDGAPIARHQVCTPGEPVLVELQVADEGVEGDLRELDVLIAHARIKDAHGNICKLNANPVRFLVSGGVDIVGPSEALAESGVASCVLSRRPGCERFRIRAFSEGLLEAEVEYELIGPTARLFDRVSRATL